MQRTILATALAAVLSWPAATLACEVEGWRWYKPDYGQAVEIEGSTTCRTGSIFLRLYGVKGEEQRFLGVSETLIEGHVFMARAEQVELAPGEDLTIRFAVERR